MITVRFPTGFSIQYNTGAKVEMWGDLVQIKDSNNSLLAMAPKDAVIEWKAPCRTYNPITIDSNRVQASVDLLAKDVRSLKRKLGK